MPANWTQPATWTVNQLVTAADMNTHLRDNLEFLKDPPTGAYKADESADYNTTSTSFVNVDVTNFAFSLDTAGGDVLIGFYGTFIMNAASREVYLDVDVNTLGRVGGNDGLIAGQNPETSVTRPIPISFTYLLRNLSAGNHIFRLQWKVDGGNATLYAGAGTTGWDLHPQFWVREI